MQGNARKAGDNEPVGDEVGRIGDEADSGVDTTEEGIEIGNGFGRFHPCLKDEGRLAELGRRNPTPGPEEPPEKHRVEGRLGDGEELEQHKHIAAGGEDEQQRVGEVIAQPGATRHDRSAILAVVGDKRTDGENGQGEDGQGLLPGINGPEESGRDRVNEREHGSPLKGGPVFDAPGLNLGDAFKDQGFGEFVHGLSALEGGYLHIEVGEVLTRHGRELRVRLIRLHVANQVAQGIE